MKPSLPHEKVEQSPVVGIYLLFLIITGALALFMNDSMLLIFAIFIIGAYIVAVTRGTGSAASRLESVGITGQNLPASIVIGIIIGFLSIAVGSIIMKVMSTGSYIELSSIIIPTTSTAIALGTATVIPSNLVIASQIILQWFTVAPGEEAGIRVLAVFALESIYNNPIFAFGGATLIWAAMHIPVWTSSGTSPTMYAVVIVWGIIWSAQFVILRNFFSNVISHATTNTLVILLADTSILTLLSSYVAVTLGIITLLLIAGGVWYATKRR